MSILKLRDALIDPHEPLVDFFEEERGGVQLVVVELELELKVRIKFKFRFRFRMVTAAGTVDGLRGRLRAWRGSGRGW